jgi:hypothetical protein
MDGCQARILRHGSRFLAELLGIWLLDGPQKMVLESVVGPIVAQGQHYNYIALR